jgi:PGF-CTERM protein/uncharacterized repeat protein (TIGR01451 family)
MDRRVAASVLVAVFVIVGLVSPVIAQASSDAVLILHFDEGSGTIAKDESGHGNEGTIYGATWTEGISGKALRFDGKGDFIEIPDDVSLDITDAITLEAWVEFTDVSEGYIISKGRDMYGLLTYRRDNGKLSFHIGGVSALKSPGTYNDGKWHHLVGTYDRNAGSNNRKLYVDGDEVNSDTQTLVIPLDNVRLGLGVWGHESGYYWKGKIDKIRIYNRALTVDEIKTHYEGKQTDLTLTKSASPHSIKQDQKTTVKITVENTGTTTIKDIEVVDTPPADFEFVSGDTSAKYGSLKPRESRTFQYTLRSGDTGKFDLGHATATYADEEGNYHTVKSNTPLVEVISSLEKPEIPTREEKKETPGFEAVFAVVGLLVVVYVLRRKK